MAQDNNDRLKDYVTVNDRISKFYLKHPNGRIHTRLLELNDQKVVVMASVWRDVKDATLDFPDATGHAEEMRDASYINKTSAVENGETSAVGRALALLGFEIKKSIASKEEVENAINQQEEIKKPMTAAQEQAIYTSLGVLKMTPTDYEKAIGRTIDSLTLGEASEYIGKLKAKVARLRAEGKANDRPSESVNDEELA